jgi:hypothetical protein
MSDLRYRVLFCALAFTAPLFAQDAQDSSPNGFVFGAEMQGSYSSIGTITKLDASAGYVFNRHFMTDAGVPYYFVFPSASTTASTGFESVEGIGNAYAQIAFMFPNPAVNYASTVTGTGPSGDRNKGLSTGHATVDWNNHVDRNFGRWTPFGEAGIANTVSDTTFFVRPFTTYGFVAHGQGGLRYRFARWLQAGAAGYVVEPYGRQTIVSRVVTEESLTSGAIASPVTLPSTPVTPPLGTLLGGLLNPPTTPAAVFETSTVTSGTAALARDSGVSTWLQLGKTPGLSLQVGFTRSRNYDLNTLSFGVGYTLRAAR